jgi:VanZ like family
MHPMARSNFKGVARISTAPVYLMSRLNRGSFTIQYPRRTLTNSSSSRNIAASPVSRHQDWGPFLFHTAWILIALLTLFPYQILPNETLSHRQEPFLFWFFEKYPQGQDVSLNILLFVPFGFGLGWRLNKWKFRWLVALVLTCAVSGAFSFCIELLQNYMPTRASSWFDVLANTAGGPLGWILFRMFGDRISLLLSFFLDNFSRILNAKIIAVLFLAYADLGIVASIPLSRETSLSNWDLSYPLVIGNIPNGEYPWHGQILDFAIADRAVNAAEAADALQNGLARVASENIVASYGRLTPGDPRDGMGASPPLHWTPQGSTDDGLKPGLLPGLGWMQTKKAAVTIEKRIRDSNQFSVFVVCEAIRTSSYGPAWMVTLAPNADERDLALGQQLSHLVFRLRTRLTGIHGQPPEYRISNFFLKTGTRKILFTYDGATLRSYWDGSRGYAMEFGPGAALFRHVRRLRQFETTGYKALYYGLIFAPLGCVLALATRIMNRLPALAVGCGLFVPSAILEPILAGASHRPLYFANILLGIGLATASYVFLRRYLPC